MTASPSPQYAHLPMLVNEQRKKLSKRRDPVAAESYRDQGYLPERVRQLPRPARLEPARRRGDRAALDADRAVPPGGRLALAGVLRREEDDAHERRVHPRARPEDFIAASAPWVAPWYSKWHPSDREPPWRQDQFSTELFAEVAQLVQERVATLGEIPAWSSSSSWTTHFDEAAFAKIIANDPVGRAILEGAVARYEALRTGTQPRCTTSSATRRRTRAGPAQGSGADSLRHHRHLGRSAALRVTELLGRETALERLRDALARSA